MEKILGIENFATLAFLNWSRWTTNWTTAQIVILTICIIAIVIYLLALKLSGGLLGFFPQFTWGCGLPTLIALIVATVLIVKHCGGGVVNVTDISINKADIALDVGAQETLVATVQPSDATIKNVSWSSGDNDVATVNNDGLLTAVAAGSTTVTATTQDGGKTATCVVAVSGVALNKTKLALNVGSEETLIATVHPPNTKNNIIWSSTDTGVATVSSRGLITGVKAGTATIIVSTEEGHRPARCTVTIIGTPATAPEQR